MEDTTNILPAYEALTVLEGVAENAKAAWKRCVMQLTWLCCYQLRCGFFQGWAWGWKDRVLS